jgi:uncharacterized Ntn-hydrolase superfamily protein
MELERLVHIYSIVARDPVTGEMGGAVQSHFFRSGAVLSGEPGVGVVASQASGDPSYGSLGLALMRSGKSPADALRGLVVADPHGGIRQVAMVDAQGRVAAHTGADTIPEAGHELGDQFSVQANMMLRASCGRRWRKRFCAATGHLAERMLAALFAAEAGGGDIRGMQSAGLVLVVPPSPERPRGGNFDLRIDDSLRPLDELRRLLRVAAGYDASNRADRAFAIAMSRTGAANTSARPSWSAKIPRCGSGMRSPCFGRDGLMRDSRNFARRGRATATGSNSRCVCRRRSSSSTAAPKSKSGEC